ncbi:hypothetical protein Glove_482g68 [Diversispora epigaea]|uniref:BTB domain-containing protein n=1 Tax=Diversispora epigaea TaxID=1348612 RepID=A0A397GJR8_9GLOM|nr:hypothetical protein Glove_482g68 [Diversispora epigaea]
MTFKFFDKLSQDFSELINDKKEYNVIIEVDRERNKKFFTAHSVVLRHRSPYFDKELENATASENHIKTIVEPSISAQIFEVILKYIYGGMINIENTDIRTIYELMVSANELELEELSVKLESYLIESKASWLRTHFSLVYHSIFDSNEFNGLKKFYNDIIAKHPNLVFESGDFTSLQETALVSILKRDDLQVEETKIWDYVIKWGISQNPTLPTNSEEWSNENFMTLKMTLQHCLPLIHYFHIPGKDIWKNIKPYEKILEKQLWDDMILHSISPNEPINSLVLPARIISSPESSSRIISAPNCSLTPNLPSRVVSTPNLTSTLNLTSTPNLTSTLDLPSNAYPRSGILSMTFSTIINKEHVAELSSWIDRKSTTYSLSDITYEFQLILRGSRDGFHPKTFWNMCHGYAGTIVVARVVGTDEIVGGYNPIIWDKNSIGRMETKDSFIFSLKNGKIQNSILSRVKNDRLALHYHNDKNIYGPYFGDCEFIMKSEVSDFTQDEQCSCFSFRKFYEKSIKTNGKFSIVDYEVFLIIKK